MSALRGCDYIILAETDIRYLGTGKGRTAGSVHVPPPGPMSERKSCENSGGLTALTSKKWGPEIFRKDL